MVVRQMETKIVTIYTALISIPKCGLKFQVKALGLQNRETKHFMDILCATSNKVSGFLEAQMVLTIIETCIDMI